jgi:hypothetical protein
MSAERYMSPERICELLFKAEALGFSLEKGSELESLTLEQLEILVERRM